MWLWEGLWVWFREGLWGVVREAMGCGSGKRGYRCGSARAMGAWFMGVVQGGGCRVVVQGDII